VGIGEKYKKILSNEEVEKVTQAQSYSSWARCPR